MRYFLDTEFIENGSTIDLLSLGLVAEDGREMYVQLDHDSIILPNDWVARHVLPSMTHFNLGTRTRTCAKTSWDGYSRDTTAYYGACSEGVKAGGFPPPSVELACPWRSKYAIAKMLKDFTNPNREIDSGGLSPVTAGKPEFWAYYGDYDWVAVCQIFGTMMDLPEGWPKFCMDIKQLAVTLSNPELPPQLIGEHNALQDARWNIGTWRWLTRFPIKLPGTGGLP